MIFRQVLKRKLVRCFETYSTFLLPFIIFMQEFFRIESTDTGTQLSNIVSNNQFVIQIGRT